MTVYAKAGAKIHDVDGKLVATLAEDVFVGQPVRPGHFVFADGRKPVVGEQMPRAVTLYLLGGPHV